ncbi:MAG: PEP-CTERM sorting domain-containing protein [Acidobacteriia bacterium]|nr:PEP-CTERM sorting domain-containing protein [Terriglobia bacterium]MBV8904143.1 PEP-CTERM sorting domain-containing protein [Terriglobia bacterium]
MTEPRPPAQETSKGGAGGTPQAALFGDVEHETDEVLGTSSALPNGGGTVPTDPKAADLFRYSAPGVRSFAINTSTAEPCTGTPTGYLSINGGITNLNPYNNCNNGGDYGDWIFDDGHQVQDAFGPDDVPSSLNLGSPEVTLLDAVGYNFKVSSVPEPGSIGLVLIGLACLLPAIRKRAVKR